MKTHFKKLRNPNYIGSWDLADANGNFQDLTVTITGAVKELVHDGKGGQEECSVVQLKGLKPMVANSTNLKMIAKVTGSPYIEDWAGKQIILTVKQVKAFGEIHDAIRVKNEKPVKPAMTASHANYALVVAAVKSGKTRPEIESKYSVTDAVWQQIVKEAANG
jgi:hypothetical protein